VAVQAKMSPLLHTHLPVLFVAALGAVVESDRGSIGVAAVLAQTEQITRSLAPLWTSVSLEAFLRLFLLPLSGHADARVVLAAMQAARVAVALPALGLRNAAYSCLAAFLLGVLRVVFFLLFYLIIDRITG
jgi:hypothetical protein